MAATHRSLATESNIQTLINNHKIVINQLTSTEEIVVILAETGPTNNNLPTSP